MALAVDSTSTSGVKNGTDPWTWSHTCASGSVLFVSVNANGAPPTGVTYNGDALTKAVERDSGTVLNSSIWYILSPDTGSAYNIVVDFATGMYGEASGISFTGADTSSQPDATASETGSSTTTNVLNITTVANNCYIIDAIAVDATWINTHIEENAAQTQLHDSTSTFLDQGSSYKDAGAAGAKTMTWTWTVNFGFPATYTHVGVSVKPAGDAPESTTIYRRRLLGVGI
jgi:hypothetical protein